MHLGLGLCHKRFCLVGGLHFVSLTYKHGNIFGNVVAWAKIRMARRGFLPYQAIIILIFFI